MPLIRITFVARLLVLRGSAAPAGLICNPAVRLFPSSMDRRNSQGPSARGCSASISPPSAARRSVLALTLEERRGFGQVHPAFLAGHLRAVNRDLVVRPERGTRSRVQRFPRPVTRPFRLSRPAIRSSLTIRTSTRTASTISTEVLLALAASTARQAQFSVGAAGPMHHEDDFRSFIVDVRDDLLNQGPHDPLLQSPVRQPGPARRSSSRQRASRTHWMSPAGAGARSGHAPRSGSRGDNALKGAVPAHLQLRRDLPVQRISSVVLPEGSIGGISGGHQIAPERLTDIVTALSLLPIHPQGRLHGSGSTALSTCSPMAASTGNPPKAMHRGSPLSIQPRLQA